MDDHNTEYLGDAVYAHFDDYGSIHLTLNDHHNRAMIVLEPETMESLIGFWEKRNRGD
jgi:hypothetical protein